MSGVGFRNSTKTVQGFALGPQDSSDLQPLWEVPRPPGHTFPFKNCNLRVKKHIQNQAIKGISILIPFKNCNLRVILKKSDFLLKKGSESIGYGVGFSESAKYPSQDLQPPVGLLNSQRRLPWWFQLSFTSPGDVFSFRWFLGEIWLGCDIGGAKELRVMICTRACKC